MRLFNCYCGNQLFFPNTRCLVCGRALGFLADRLTLAALEPTDAGDFRALGDAGGGRLYRKCEHYASAGVCNWMIAAGDANPFCEACRLNQVIPNLDAPGNYQRWAKVEGAKRRLIYDLKSLGLPLIDKKQDPEHGLAFAFLEDMSPSLEFLDPSDGGNPVLTGHAGGLITINIIEADDVAREQMRLQMKEAYRTLLGHFRHESGHYYWEWLIRRGGRVDAFRRIFGDERADYDTALSAYYENGPPPRWHETHISAYATAHPWEDWGESWAHYLHMADTLETAAAVGLAEPHVPGAATEFDRMIGRWMRLTVAMNAINQSMGLNDLYPFVLTDAVIAKLRFVDEVAGAGRTTLPDRRRHAP